MSKEKININQNKTRMARKHYTRKMNIHVYVYMTVHKTGTVTQLSEEMRISTMSWKKRKKQTGDWIICKTHVAALVQLIKGFSRQDGLESLVYRPGRFFLVQPCENRGRCLPPHISANWSCR